MSDFDSSDSDADSGSTGGRRTKVQRIIDEREFEGFGAELERLWTTDDEEQRSLRELADLFNRRVLTAEADRAGMQLLDEELETVYAMLTDDDVGSETQVEVQRRLDREGIDPDSLTDDFVTHQAIHTYLTKHRGATNNAAKSTTSVDDGRRTINRLQGRLTNVVSNTLQTLTRAGAVTLGDVDVFVTVTVACKDCGTQREVNALLEDGGCKCN